MSAGRSLWQLHGAVLLFGLSGLFGKWLDLPASGIVLGRTTLAALALGIPVWWWGREAERAVPVAGDAPEGRWARGGWGWVGLGGVLLAFHWLAFFASIQASTVAVGVLSYSTFPLFVVLLEPLLFGARWRAGEVATAVVALAGVAVLVPAADLRDPTARGVAWGLAAGCSFAVLTLANGRQVRVWGPWRIAAIQNAVAALAVLPLVAVQGAWPEARHGWALLGLGLGCTALAHTWFIRSLAHVRPQVASVVGCLEAPYGVLFAALWLGEVPAARTWVGGGLILAAAVWAMGRRGR